MRYTGLIGLADQIGPAALIGFSALARLRDPISGPGVSPGASATSSVRVTVSSRHTVAQSHCDAVAWPPIGGLRTLCSAGQPPVQHQAKGTAQPGKDSWAGAPCDGYTGLVAQLTRESQAS